MPRSTSSADPSRSLAFARDLGFDHVWLAADLPDVPFDAVVDASNDAAMPAFALDRVEPAKRVVYIGLSGTPSTIDTRMLALKDVTAVGILSGSLGLAGAIELYASGAVDPRPLVAATVGLGEVADVLAGRRPAGRRWRPEDPRRPAPLSAPGPAPAVASALSSGRDPAPRPVRDPRPGASAQGGPRGARLRARRRPPGPDRGGRLDRRRPRRRLRPAPASAARRRGGGDRPVRLECLRPVAARGAADGAATAIVVATDWPDDVERAHRRAPVRSADDTQIVVVADGATAADEPRLAALADQAARGRADDRAARPCGGHQRRDPPRHRGDGRSSSTRAWRSTGDIVAPLAAPLRDPGVGVAGPWGFTSNDLRHFEDAPSGDVDAIDGYCQAFRRMDFVERGPLDERFVFYRNLDIWWSLVLRDEGEDAPPRRAVAVDLPAIRHEHRGWTSLPEAERDRLSKRNFYRVLDRFGARRDLLISASVASGSSRRDRP